jgi:aspartate ammonia-lyase
MYFFRIYVKINISRTNGRYKKVMDKAILVHRRKLSREINNLKSSNSQEFWKLLKKGKTREKPNIPINKLFEFFTTLNDL